MFMGTGTQRCYISFLIAIYALNYRSLMYFWIGVPLCSLFCWMTDISLLNCWVIVQAVPWFTSLAVAISHSAYHGCVLVRDLFVPSFSLVQCWLKGNSSGLCCSNMGAASSSDNDGLIDYLVNNGYLDCRAVERAFRFIALLYLRMLGYSRILRYSYSTIICDFLSITNPFQCFVLL